MEVVAVLLPPIVVVGILALLVTAAAARAPLFVGAAASWTLFGVAAVFLPWMPHSTGHVGRGVTIAVANVLARNTRPLDAATNVAGIDADIVVVPEDTRTVHEQLARKYPYARRYELGNSWLGVYARVPVKERAGVTPVFDPSRYLRLEVGGPTPFVLWALHLPRPWITPKGTFQMRPGGHARVLSAFVEAIDAETGPVVVAGDLNLTDRGRGYRKLTAHLDDAMRGIRGARTEIKPSYRPLLLNIDHILEPPGWCADHARRFVITGSDHRGITARVGPCRGG